MNKRRISIPYENLHNEDIKVNNKLIMEYHKKYKIKYLTRTVFIGLIVLYSIAYYGRRNGITIDDCIEIFPIAVTLLVMVFFALDMIKWSLERFGIFKAREIKICRFANEYLDNIYRLKQISEEQFERLKIIYKI